MSGRLVSSVIHRAASTKGVLRRINNNLLAPCAVRTFAVAPAAPATDGLPPSLERVGKISAFPNEYPGQVYAFNWCLNGDGVTPVNKSAFRIVKPLDLKVAGVPVPTKMPLAVKAAAASKMPEAGGAALSFGDFDAASQTVRDALSLSASLYCPEGHVPGTRTAVRVITNSATLASQLLAYLERAPRLEPPVSLPITVYALEGSADAEFAGFAIEEVEVPVKEKIDNPGWITVSTMAEPPKEAKSVAAVVVASKATPDLKVIVAGMEASQKALAADELERQAKKDAEEAAGAGSD